MVGKALRGLIVLIWVSGFLVGCATRPASVPEQETSPKVVATTTIVADVVRQVAGDTIELSVLLPAGADPHGFAPSPQDIARVADAALVFVNGAGLEEFLEPLLENAGGEAEVVHVSDGIALLEGEHHHHDDADHYEDDHDDADHHEDDDNHHHAHTEGDPHTWTDPNNVLIWVDNIEAALIRHVPVHAETYRANAEAYRDQLRELDAWVRSQVEQIPVGDRRLVTDHTVFTYFAARYGFEQVGAIVPGYSTSAQPSARELAQLEDQIRQYGVKAIFVGKTVNPTLAARLAEDTGIHLVYVYTGSLTEAGGEADSYLSYVRYNVTAIVEALK